MISFPIRVGRWVFAPGLASTLITLLIIPLFVHLGFWQLSRAQEKKMLTELLNRQMNEKQTPYEDLKFITNKNSLLYRRVQVTGEFLNEYAILLDNKIHQGRVGYYVLTPFKPFSSHQVFLVNRGWIPATENRNTSPTLKPVLGKVSLNGILDFPSRQFQLKNLKPESTANRHFIRIQQINFTDLAEILKIPLESLSPFIFQLDLDSPYTFTHIPIRFGSSATRHLGYMVQWFSMALAVFIYFLMVNSRKWPKEIG